jgi:hypothetical protein
MTQEFKYFPAQSPFEVNIKAPYEEFFKPLSDVVYIPIKYISATFRRPDDQSIYMLASTTALVCCLVLK